MLVNNSKNLYSNRSKCTKNENFFLGEGGFPSKKKFVVSRTQFFHKVFIFLFSLKIAKQTIFVSKQMGKRLILISNFQNCHATTAAIALYRFIVCIKTFY